MSIIIDDDLLSDGKYDAFLNSIIPNVPFYFTEHAVHEAGDLSSIMCHTSYRHDKAHSNVYEYVENMCKDFCEKHSIVYDKMLKCVVNATFPSSLSEGCPFHKDHNIKKHKNLLVYLNTVDGETIIFKENSVYIQPKEKRILCFDGDEHSFKLPTIGPRFVIVVTFQEKE